MRAPNRIPIVQPAVKQHLRDIEEPRYPRRILLAISGLDGMVFQAWQFRHILDRVKLDGQFIAIKCRRKTGRSSWRYSILDILKLSLMQVLVAQGVRPEIASQAPAALEGALSVRNRGELLRTTPEDPIAFGLTEDGLELVWFRSKAGFNCSFETPLEALRYSNLMACFLIDWPVLVKGVLGELEEFDESHG